MKRNRKSCLALLLATVLVLLLMAGCTSDTPSGSPSPAASTPPPGESQNTDTPPGQGLGFTIMENGLPRFDEPTELSIMLGLGPVQTDSYTNSWGLKWLAEQCNIIWNIQESPNESILEKTGLVLAGDEFPDLYMGCASTAAEAFSGSKLSVYASQGLVLELDPYLETYAPNLSAIYKNDPESASFGSVNGHYYSFPQFEDGSGIIVNINSQWLSNLGLEKPTNLDELYAVLAAFKQNDANGNGDPNDEIPLSLLGFNYFKNFMPYFGMLYSETNNDLYIYPGETQAKYPYIQPEMKEMVKYFNRLWEEGLLDEESFYQDRTTITTKGNADQIGMLVGPGPFVYVGSDKIGQWDNLGVFADKNGNYYNNGSAFLKIGAGVLSSTCSHPEFCVALLDWFYSEEGTRFCYMGVEGITYEYIDDDTWDWILESDELGTVTVTELRKNNLLSKPFPYLYKANEAVWSQQNDAAEVEIMRLRKISNQYDVQAFPNITLSEEDQLSISTIVSDVSSYCQNMIVSFITGETDIDAEWDNYVATANSMGVEELVSIYQGYVDAK